MLGNKKLLAIGFIFTGYAYWSLFSTIDKYYNKRLSEIKKLKNKLQKVLIYFYI